METELKKIGILAFVKEEYGGVLQYTQSIVKALTYDKENNYVIFCNVKNKIFDNYGFEVRKINEYKDSLFINMLKLLALNFNFSINFFLTKQEKKIFNDIDFFISPTITAYPHYFLNKPFIFTLHDMQERYYPSFFTLKEKIRRIILNKALAKKADKIICESEFVKNDIMKFLKIDANKVFVIPAPPPENFINFKFDYNNFDKIKAKYNLPDKYLFYPAHFWFHKNHLKLIEAFGLVTERHNDICLILTGSKQNNYDNVLKKIKELNLDNKIKHLGLIDYLDLPYIYKMSLMLVMPSLFESISIPIYEAFALKVPVCCSNVTAIPWQVGDAGFIFDPFNVNDIAKNILLYIENEDLRKEKAEKGFNKVFNFNHREYFENLKKLLSV